MAGFSDVPIFICQGCGTEQTSWEGRCPQCGVSETIRLQPNTDRMVDRLIKNKWKIIRKLGQGGMGAVYLAEQAAIGHRVALKFLKSEFSSDAEIVRRFINEAKSYALVNHPNAVTFHEVGQDDQGNLYIAMEYCEGVDLKKVIAEEKRLAVVDAVEVVLQVADVLATAHSRGVIHRDLKPENIMIRRGMRGVHAKVLDFGIARLMDAGTRLTVAGAIAGTPRYMSPEQVEGKEVDLRADIYSLGIVLYEALTGKQPFDGMTIAEILRKQVVEPMPHLTEALPELDIPELDAVIQKACAKRREERWPDLLTFASALSQALPTQAHLALSPLQRSGLTTRVSSVAATSPAPDARSGIAVPGTQLDDVQSGAATLVKSAETERATGPIALTIPAATPAPTLQGTSVGVVPESLIIPPRPSRGPMIAVFFAVVVLAGGGVYLLSIRDPGPAPIPKTSTNTGMANSGGTSTGNPNVVANTATATNPENGTDPNTLAADVVRAMKEEKSRGNLSTAKTDFENARLDAAENDLKGVDEGTASFGEAQQLLGKIKTIREALAAASRKHRAGDCDGAVPLYRKVLALNAKVDDALTGVRACNAAEVPLVIP